MSAELRMTNWDGITSPKTHDVTVFNTESGNAEEVVAKIVRLKSGWAVKSDNPTLKPILKIRWPNADAAWDMVNEILGPIYRS